MFRGEFPAHLIFGVPVEVAVQPAGKSHLTSFTATCEVQERKAEGSRECFAGCCRFAIGEGIDLDSCGKPDRVD